MNYYQSRDAEVSRLLKEANLPEDIGEAAAQIVATVKGIPVEQARAQQTMMRDLTLLGDADAREIIENGDIETELARLEKKPLHLRSTRDKQCFLRLSEAKALNDSAAELEKRGVDVEALRKNQAFADFGRKLSPELPIAEKYDLFKKLTQPPAAQVTPPPSVKNAGGTAKKEFYTPDEVDRMSKEEVNANLNAITKSMASKTNGW